MYANGNRSEARTTWRCVHRENPGRVEWVKLYPWERDKLQKGTDISNSVSAYQALTAKEKERWCRTLERDMVISHNDGIEPWRGWECQMTLGIEPWRELHGECNG